jgi:hypothetical protein
MKQCWIKYEEKIEKIPTKNIFIKKICHACRRANGKSYVCDVNGFSFVKNSHKYYDDCSKILGNMILRHHNTSH